MNDARTTLQTDSPRPLRAQRSAEAVVAQYIHELSGRHARTTHESRAEARRLWTGCGPVHSAVSHVELTR